MFSKYNFHLSEETDTSALYGAITKKTVSLVLGDLMRTNIKVTDNRKTETTHNGLKVAQTTNEFQLIRSVLANMLWEDEFYEDGESNVARIKKLIASVSPVFVGELAELARTEFKLRHVPLLLMRELARNGQLRAEQLTSTIQRPDEISEFLSIYWKDGKTPISNQVKKGLANAFHKFNEFELSKWDKNSSAISLRDVMFLTHANPRGKDALFKRIANQEMGIADTWETRLSAGANKKETFAELMSEGRLGALAFLRNLRNMVESDISEDTIRAYAKTVNVEKVLPFRYIAAAKIVPQFEDMLEEMMLRSLSVAEKLLGKTVLLVDVSGSMWMGNVSAKSELSRFEAAAALAMLCREICEDVEIYTFSNNLVRVNSRRGFALREQLYNSQPHSGTNMGQAVTKINQTSAYDRIVVFTDEQTSDRVPKPNGKGYVINVASYKNGINSGAWSTITGFSEATLEFIRILETFQNS